MPTARREAAEESVLRRLLVEMEGLGIEFFREGLDLIGVDAVGRRGETLTRRHVVESETACDCIAHDRLPGKCHLHFDSDAPK